MAIGGVTSGVASGSYRDKWNNKDLLEEEDGEKTEGTGDRKSTRLNSSHIATSRMPSSA